MSETVSNTPRAIRRYANRKLYDVRTSTYVALEDLAVMVRAGEEVRVVDTVSGEDITAQTLTQVILDEGKRGPSLLPTDLLYAALRRGGRALDAGRGVVSTAVSGAVGGAVDSAVGAIGTVRHAADDLLHTSLGRLARVLPGARADEVDALRRQIAELERTVAELVRERAPAAALDTSAAVAAPPHPDEDSHP